MARAHQQEQEVWVCSDDRYHHHAPLADDAPPPTLAWPGGRSTKKRGGRRGRGARWSSNERSGGGGGRSCHGPLCDLLQDEVVPNLQEGGERPLPGDPCPQVAIGVVETPQDIEHQDAVSHRAAEVMKGISHTLHPPAVLTNGEVPPARRCGRTHRAEERGSRRCQGTGPRVPARPGARCRRDS